MTITADTLSEALKAAKPGDVLKCSGLFPKMNTRRLPDGIVLEGGIWAGLRADYTVGLEVRFATFIGDGTDDGIKIVGGRDLHIHDNAFIDLQVGCALPKTVNCRLISNGFVRMRGDGATFFQGPKGVLVERNSVVGSINPLKASARHPDGFQFREGEDITILNNYVEGRTQAYGLHDGPFKRVKIIGNRAAIGSATGIAVRDCDGLEVRDNHVSTMPGAKHKADIALIRCTNVVRSGNRVDAYGRHKAEND